MKKIVASENAKKKAITISVGKICKASVGVSRKAQQTLWAGSLSVLGKKLWRSM